MAFEESALHVTPPVSHEEGWGGKLYLLRFLLESLATQGRSGVDSIDLFSGHRKDLLSSPRMMLQMEKPHTHKSLMLRWTRMEFVLQEVMERRVAPHIVMIVAKIKCIYSLNCQEKQEFSSAKVYHLCFKQPRINV